MLYEKAIETLKKGKATTFGALHKNEGYLKTSCMK